MTCEGIFYGIFFHNSFVSFANKVKLLELQWERIVPTSLLICLYTTKSLNLWLISEKFLLASLFKNNFDNIVIANNPYFLYNKYSKWIPRNVRWKMLILQLKCVNFLIRTYTFFIYLCVFLTGTALAKTTSNKNGWLPLPTLIFVINKTMNITIKGKIQQS